MILQSNVSRVALEPLILVVEEFRKYDPKMELGQLLVYLHSAVRPGIKMTELETLTGLTRSSISRNVLALSRETYQKDAEGHPRPGHDLVKQLSDPLDARAKLVAPTRRGAMLAEKVASLLKTGEYVNGTTERRPMAG